MYNTRTKNTKGEKNMKKQYQTPVCAAFVLDAADIVRTSESAPLEVFSDGNDF